MKNLLRFAVSPLLIFAIFQNVLPCGPSYVSPVFDNKYAPENPFENFAAGKIGIIKPDYHRSVLLAAYRYLTGGNFTSEEQKSLVEVWKADFNNEDYDTDDIGEAVKGWLAKRQEVFGKNEKTPEIYAERQYGGYDFFPNCTPNAFEIAAQTLSSRITSYGAADKDVKSWIKTQDAVFTNCASGRQIPDQVDASAAEWLQKDAAYQIAAAEFYSLNYAEAKRRFAEIALDSNSPWQETSDYLVGRTLIRQASLAKAEEKADEFYAEAETQLQAVSGRGGKFADSAERLLGLIKYRIHPQERTRELAQKLTFQPANQNLRQDLIDYTWLLDKFEKQILEAEEKRKEAEIPRETALNTNSNSSANSAGNNQEYSANTRTAGVKKNEDDVSIYLYDTKSQKNWTFYISPDATDDDALAEAEKVVGSPLSDEMKKDVRSSRQSAYTARFSSNRQPEYQGGYFGEEKTSLSILPEFLRQDDLTDWLFTYRIQNDEAYLYALSKFNQTGADLWLMTALSKAGRSSAGLNILLEAANRSSHSAPAYPTIAYHTARIYLATGKIAEAKKILDEILAADEFPISTRNQFLGLRAQIAATLEEYLTFSLRKPFAFDYDGEQGTVDEFIAKQKSWYDPKYNKESREEYDRSIEKQFAAEKKLEGLLLFDSDTMEVINQHFPLSVLIETEKSAALPDYLRGEFALAIWTRAMLVNDAVSMRKISPELIKYQPEMESLLTKIEAAKTSLERQDAILYFVLKNPILTPYVEDELNKSDNTTDSYDSNDWWCLPYEESGEEGESSNAAALPPKPLFLTEMQSRAAQNERKKFKELGNAPKYFGEKVVSWAKRAPNDRRIPESLFIAFEANGWKKYGCGDNDELKTEIENLLNTRYSQSEWTKKSKTEEQ